MWEYSLFCNNVRVHPFFNAINSPSNSNLYNALCFLNIIQNAFVVNLTAAQVTHRWTGSACILTFLHSLLLMSLRHSVSSNTWNSQWWSDVCACVGEHEHTHAWMSTGWCVFDYKHKANHWPDLWLNSLTLKTQLWVRLAFTESVGNKMWFNAKAL